MRIILIILFSAAAVNATEVHKVSFPPPPNMTRAEVWFAATSQRPRAVLVLCPGMNGSAESLVRNRAWQDFATRNDLALAGLSFASSSDTLFADRGYTLAESGSGRILLQAVRSACGRDLPLMIYGFSSGAYFTEMMAAWRPEAVKAWCAHATGRFDTKPGRVSPGIVSCGEHDAPRYGAALMHFQRGRATSSRLLWISLRNCGHEWPEELDSFVRCYFEALLRGPEEGEWVDIDKKIPLTPAEASRQPTISGWLPSANLLKSWQTLHHP